MSPVSKLGQILAVARAKIKASPQNGASSQVGQTSATAVSVPRGRRGTPLGWRANLKASLSRLNLSDRGDCSLARRVLVQALLVRELGDGLLLDPQWPHFLDEVINVLESDPELAEELNQLAHRFRGDG